MQTAQTAQIALRAIPERKPTGSKPTPGTMASCFIGGETPTCCGGPMEPELAEARDGSASKFFATVWRCLRCQRIRC